MASDALVLHVDMDAFYASCEEARASALRGRPVVVGWDPREGLGRGVVVSANYAARALGVRTAMPAGEALRRAPTAHFVSPDHRYYVRVSRAIFDDLAQTYPIEQVSIDEAYLDRTGLTPWPRAAELAAAVRARVEAAARGLTCSVGVGPNRLVAKVASDHRKPGGTTIVPAADAEAFLGPLPVGRIPGIGPKTAARLGRLGVRTVGHLRAVPRERLVADFGMHGAFMNAAAHGLEAGAFRPDARRRRSASAEHTFAHDTRDRRAVLRDLRALASSLERGLAQRAYWYRTVALKVRFADFQTRTRQASLARPTPDAAAARRILPRLLEAVLRDPRPVRLVGIRLGGLVRRPGQRRLDDCRPGEPRVPTADAGASPRIGL